MYLSSDGYAGVSNETGLIAFSNKTLVHVIDLDLSGGIWNESLYRYEEIPSTDMFYQYKHQRKSLAEAVGIAPTPTPTPARRLQETPQNTGLLAHLSQLLASLRQFMPAK